MKDYLIFICTSAFWLVLYIFTRLIEKNKPNKYYHNCKTKKKNCINNIRVMQRNKNEFLMIFLLNIMVISIGIVLVYGYKLSKMYGLMLFGNSLGAIIRHFKYEETQEENLDVLALIKHFSIGLGACLLLPLFFNLIQSNLIEEILKGDNSQVKAYSVILSFSVLASLFSEKVIQFVGDKVFKEVQEVKESLEEKAKVVKELESVVNELKIENEELRRAFPVKRNEEISSETDVDDLENKIDYSVAKNLI